MANRRGNGEGSITKVRENLWMGRVMIGYKSDGKPNRKSIYGKTRKEVQDKLVALLNEINTGTYVEPTKITLIQWLQDWLKKYKSIKLKPLTYDLYEILIQTSIKSEIGNILLKDLRPAHIQGFYNTKYSDGYSPSTIRKFHAVLRGALEQAVRNNLIPQNPALHVELPSMEPKVIKAFTLEEQKRFEECARKYQYYPAFIVALDTGLRMSELLALRWDDIDLVNGYVVVNKNLVFVKDRENDTGKNVFVVQNTTKTKSGNRKIPLTQRALKLLKELKLKQVSKSDIVFCNKKGSYILKRNFQRTFYNIIKQVGIPKCGVHTLRHTFATRLFERGVPEKTISDLLGHSSISFTLDTYTHVLPDTKQDAIKVLDEIYHCCN
ncbi:MAG: hypothetical protein PWP27_1396 [Clostridiales bacterium]|jgi:integrase|nr:hypothetical protein [Clostridiales bacterium]